MERVQCELLVELKFKRFEHMFVGRNLGELGDGERSESYGGSWVNCALEIRKFEVRMSLRKLYRIEKQTKKRKEGYIGRVTLLIQKSQL